MKTLGRSVRDKITGFKGIATGHVIYISGCNQYLVAPPIDKDGKVPEPLWIDEQRLEFIGEKQIVLDNSVSRGFDLAPPVR